MSDANFVERLRRHLQAAQGDAGERCPPADSLWDLAQGSLSPAAAAEVVDHVSFCSACAEALACAPREGSAARPSPAPWRRAAAAALLVGLAGAAALVLQRGEPAAIERTGAGSTRGALVASTESARVARTRPRLSWTGGAADARYTIVVTDGSLRPVVRAAGLAEPSFVVPPAALAQVPPGGRLLWRVEERAPDGTTRASATFVTLVD